MCQDDACETGANCGGPGCEELAHGDFEKGVHLTDAARCGAEEVVLVLQADERLDREEGERDAPLFVQHVVTQDHGVPQAVGHAHARPEIEAGNRDVHVLDRVLQVFAGLSALFPQLLFVSLRGW
jgi:hypothetical protein